jgi:hypothetical protein
VTPNTQISRSDHSGPLKIVEYADFSLSYVEDSLEIPYTLRVARCLMTTERLVLAYSREGA